MARRVFTAGVVLVFLGFGAEAEAQPVSAPRPAPAPAAEETAARTLLAGGKPREALAELDRAASTYRTSRDRLGLARVGLARSTAHRALGDLDRAAQTAAEARSEPVSEPNLRLRILIQVALVATDRSDFAGAEAALREGLRIANALDARALADTRRAFAILEERRGRSHEAAEHSEHAIQAADRSGDVALRVRTRSAAALVLLAVSRYDAALAAAQEGYEIAGRASQPALRAGTLFDLAQTNAHIWNLDRAAELWGATIEAYERLGATRIVALAVKQRVETRFALGDFERAAADGEKAVALLQQTGQGQYVAEAAARVALSEIRRSRSVEARAWADRARAALTTAPESRHLFVHNDLGIVEAELGNLVAARDDYTRVLKVARQVGNVEYEWRAHWGFGRAALRDGPASAIAPLELAIAIVERLRQTIPAAGLRAAFMINRVGPYETLVEAHMAAAAGTGNEGVRRALEVAERARSRALADLLAEAHARSSDARVAAVRDEETAFGRRFSAVQKRVAASAGGAAREAALRELQELEREYETLVVRIRRDNPAYAALTHPRALSADELSAMLGPDEALLEFLLTDAQGFAWVVRRDSVQGYRVPNRKAIDAQLRLLTALLAARDEAATQQLGARLYQSLLGPAEAALRGARRLIIVPDGPLQRLPFALLRSNDRWLIETRTIAVAPSATILKFLRESRRPRAPEPLLALAVPEARPGQTSLFDAGTRGLGVLSYAADEVAAARRLLGAGRDSVRVGPEATEPVLKSPDAGRYRIVHLAAHAIADEIVPRRSAVLLTPSGQEDGLLQVSEIANLSLNADLVVLAACRSHVGRLVRGEGLLGLSRAFMHAGARAVVATAWTVPDRETAWLMRRFYAALRDAIPPDEALRRAQLQALQSGGTRAAAGAWAGFIVVGDAHRPILDRADGTGTGTATVAAVTAAIVLTGMALAATRLRRRRQGPRSSHAEARSR